MRAPGDDCVRQIADGSLKFLVRDGVIPRSQGGLTARQRGFARRYGGLTPLHFAVSDAVHVLRESGDGEEGKEKSAKRKGSEGPGKLKNLR